MTSSKRKRQDWEHGPDYSDFPQPERKRLYIAEEENAEGPVVDKDVETIRAIVRKEFGTDIAERTNQLFEIQTALCTAQETLARLRIVAASHYYTRSKLQIPVERNDPASKEQTRIHPAIKKLLGASIKPVTSPSRRRVATLKQADAAIGKPKPSVETPSKISVEIPSNSLVETSSPGCSAVLAAPSTSNFPESPNAGGEAGGPRYIPPTKKEALHCNKKRRVDMMIQKRLLVGNISRWLVADSREDRASHRWMIYVRFMDNERPDRYISRVRYLLHPSYKPNDVVEVTAAPFHLSRRGWGEFQVRVQVHFRNAADKPLDIRHNVKLDKTCSGRDTLGSETHVNVWLHTDNSEIIRQPDDEDSAPPSDPQPPHNDNASSSSRPQGVGSGTSATHSVPPSNKQSGPSPPRQEPSTSPQQAKRASVEVANCNEDAANGSSVSSLSLPTGRKSLTSARNGLGPAEFGFKIKEELLEVCGNWETCTADIVHASNVWDKSCSEPNTGNEDIASFAKDSIVARGVLDLYKKLFPCKDTSVREEIEVEEIVHEEIVSLQENVVTEEIVEEEIVVEEIVVEEIVEEEIVEEEIVDSTEILNSPTFTEPLVNALVKPARSDVTSSAGLPVNNTIITCDNKIVKALDHRTQTEPTVPVLVKIMQPNGLFVYLTVNPKNILKSSVSGGTAGNIVVNSSSGAKKVPPLNVIQQNGVKNSQVFSKPSVVETIGLPAVHTLRQDSQLNISASLNNLQSKSTVTSIESPNFKLQNDHTGREKTVLLPNVSKDSAYKTLTPTTPHISLQNSTQNIMLNNRSKLVLSTDKSALLSNLRPTLTPISRSLLQKTVASVLGTIPANPSAIGQNRPSKSVLASSPEVRRNIPNSPEVRPNIPSSTGVQQQRTVLNNGAKGFQLSDSRAQHVFPIRGGTSLLKSQSLLKSAHVAPAVGNSGSLGQPVAGSSGSVYQPVAGCSKSVYQPVVGCSKSVYQPVAGCSKSVYQPVAGCSKSVYQPVAGSSKSVYQPVAGSKGSLGQPVAGSSGIGRVPGGSGSKPVAGHTLTVPVAANRAGAQVAAAKGNSQFLNGMYGTLDKSGTLVLTPDKSLNKSHKPGPLHRRVPPTQVYIPRVQVLPVDIGTILRKNHEDLMEHVQQHCARIEDLRHAVKVVAVRLPLVDPAAAEPHFRAVHPYCAPSARAFMQWPAPKRAFAEWLRAKTINRCLLKCVRCPTVVWSTRHIAEYLRLHGFTPTCVDSELELLDSQSELASKSSARPERVSTWRPRLEPVSAPCPESEPVPGPSSRPDPVPGPSSRPDPVPESRTELVSASNSQTIPVSASSFRTEPVSVPSSQSDPAPPWSIPVSVLEWLKARPPGVDADPEDAVDDGEEIDVVSVPTGAADVRIKCAEVIASHADTLRMTHEQQFLCEFVRNTARLVDVDLHPEEIAPGTTFRAAESVVWMAVRSLVDDLTRRSFCKAWEKNSRPPRDILPNDVRAAVSSRQEFDFLTNSDLGIRPTDTSCKHNNNSGGKEPSGGGRKPHD